MELDTSCGGDKLPKILISSGGGGLLSRDFVEI